MRRSLAGIAAAISLLAAGCSGGDDGGGGGGNGANLRVNLTDAPAPGVRAVNVTVTKVSVHQSADAGTGAAGWREMAVTAPMPVELLRLRGGVLVQLCAARLAAGHYQQVRLELAQNAGRNPPFRNSVRTAEGELKPLDVPSEIKLVHSFRVADGTTTDLTLDFKAEESLRQRGNGEWFMQPVIGASSTTK